MPEPVAVVEGQEPGQVIDQPPVQPEPVVAPDDGMYVRIPRSNYSHLADDGDFNKVVHMGNQYKDAEKSGLLALGQALADAGMDPYSFLSQWNSPEEPPTAGPVPAPEPAAGPAGPAAGQQMPWSTKEEFDKAVSEQVSTQMSQGFQKERDRTATESASSAQDAAIDSALDGLGYKASPTKFTLGGTDQELSPVRDLLIRPAILLTAQRIHAQALNRNAPDYEQRLYGPMSAKTIEEATAHVKQVMALTGQQQLETEADNQVNLPQASLGDGAPGGRVKKAPADMSPAELKAAVNKHVADARGKRGG